MIEPGVTLYDCAPGYGVCTVVHVKSHSHDRDHGGTTVWVCDLMRVDLREGSERTIVKRDLLFTNHYLDTLTTEPT